MDIFLTHPIYIRYTLKTIGCSENETEFHIRFQNPFPNTYNYLDTTIKIPKICKRNIYFVLLLYP